MEAETRDTEPEESDLWRRATEGLLAWGFTPREIASSLGCSQGWVRSVQRLHEGGGPDPDAEGSDETVTRRHVPTER